MATSKIQTIYFSVDVAPKAHDMGRNLLRGAALDSMTDIYDGDIALLRYVGCDDSHAQIVDGIDGAKALAVTVDSGETEQYRGPHFMARVVPGTTYTASVYVKSTTGQYLYLEAKKYGATADTWYSSTHSTPMTTSTNWERKTFTFTAAEGYDYVQINFFALASGTIYFCEPKLERGDTATAFSLNELDLKGASGKNNFLHVAWCNNIEPSTQKPSKDEPIYLSKDTQGASYDYMGTWVSETEETTEAEARELATWVYIKGAKGDDGSTYDIYLSKSVLKGDSTGKLNDLDRVPVTAKVVKVTGGTATQVTSIDEAYFTISRTETGGDIVSYSRNNESEFTVEKFYAWGSYVKTWNFSLYVGGVFLKTVTLPVIRDGANGNGTPATVYTIEPVGNINASGTLTDANEISVDIAGDVKAYKITGDSKEEYSSQPQSWRLSIGKENHDGISTFNNNADNNIISFKFSNDYDLSNTPGSAVITLFSDSSLTDQLASLIVPISLNPNAIVDVNTELGTIQSTTASMQKDMDGIHGTIETIKQGQGEINLKVQDLQNGGIDTSKPHTSSQVDFTSLSDANFYPVLIQFKDDGGKRHTVEINRPLDEGYGTGKSYMTHGRGFSFRMLFSDVANDWGSREGGQLRIESISQYWTSPSDTPICPKIAQYYIYSFMVAWLRGGSKYDITVDCVDAYISGIWPYMMQVASNPSWVPDAVRLAPADWTTAQINAQGDNAYNLLKHDDGGFYSDTDNEYLYRFGNLTAGHTFAIVGQPKDSKQWFLATWHIASVSGSKVYVDISSYSIVWQTQNPIGIRMNGILGYIKKGVSYSKSTWDSEQGFGTYEILDDTAVHANWVASRPILIIGEESSATDGVYRDRAVLETVETCSEGSSVSFYSYSYFDVSPLYGTDGRTNVKTDMLATGIDIKSHKITLTADKTTVRSNSGTELAMFYQGSDGKAYLNTDIVNADAINSNRVVTKDNGHGHTIIHDNTCVWTQADGVTPGIEVSYDTNGVPHFVFYDTNGNKVYDLGFTGLQSLLQGVTPASVTAVAVNDIEIISNTVSALSNLSGRSGSTVGEYHCAYTNGANGSKVWVIQDGNYGNMDGKFIMGTSQVDSKGNDYKSLTLANGYFLQSFELENNDKEYSVLARIEDIKETSGSSEETYYVCAPDGKCYDKPTNPNGSYIKEIACYHYSNGVLVKQGSVYARVRFTSQAARYDNKPLSVDNYNNMYYTYKETITDITDELGNSLSSSTYPYLWSKALG